jgi:hypothetical protein
MSLVQRRIERRVTAHFGPADGFVRNLYGLKEKPLPILEVKPIETPAEQQGNVVRFNQTLVNAFRFYRTLSSYAVHESTHYYCRGSVLSNLLDLLGSWKETPYFKEERGDEYNSIKCASEGLATFSEKRYLDRTKPSAIEKAIKFLDRLGPYLAVGLVSTVLIGLTILPLTVIRFFGTNSLKNKIEYYIDRFQKYCTESNKKPKPFNYYSEGLKFVTKLQDIIGNSADVFKIVTQHPPSSMAEINNPEHYLAVNQKFVDELKRNRELAETAEGMLDARLRHGC